MPATNAAMPKPASFVLLTLIPEAAAALVRADGQHPLPEAGAPHVGDEEGGEDRRDEDEDAEHGAREVVVDASEGRVRREIEPPSSGCVTGEPVGPPPQRALRKPNCSSARAAASVTTTRLTPRTRRRDGDQQPDDGRRAAPISSEMGNSAQMPPRSVVRCDIVKPATPASASCTTEICPTKPTMTTSERQMRMPRAG